jgi:hypothetical protein
MELVHAVSRDDASAVRERLMCELHSAMPKAGLSAFFSYMADLVLVRELPVRYVTRMVARVNECVGVAMVTPQTRRWFDRQSHNPTSFAEFAAVCAKEARHPKHPFLIAAMGLYEHEDLTGLVPRQKLWLMRHFAIVLAMVNHDMSPKKR